MQCGRGQESVDNRQSFSPSFCFRSEQTPTVGNRGINRHNSPGEAGLQVDFEPRFQARPTFSVIKSGNPFANLPERLGEQTYPFVPFHLDRQ
jgi:hypothetical protein